MALAAAVGWASSDEDTPGEHAIADSGSGIESVARRARPTPGDHGASHRVANDTSPATAMLTPAPATRSPSPSPAHSASRDAGPEEAARASIRDTYAARGPAPAERPPAVHIGSIEIELVDPPGEGARAAPAAPPARLARGFTSAIGLRQS